MVGPLWDAAQGRLDRTIRYSVWVGSPSTNRTPHRRFLGRGVSAGTSGIDWHEVERHERRGDMLVAPGMITFFVGIVLLTGGFACSTGGVAWAVVRVFLSCVVLVSASVHLIRRLHTSTSAG
jgi:hypothetical protein